MIKNLKETVDAMLSDDHVKRLGAEYLQTQYRLDKLYDVIKKHNTHQLEHKLDCDIKVLNIQADAMATYLDCLAERLCAYADGCDEDCEHCHD